jgi:hypothetical protein
MDKALKNKLTRVVVYPKDVSRITGKSERYGRKLLKTIKEMNDKDNHQFVSLEEFSDYTGLPVELIKEHIID